MKRNYLLATISLLAAALLVGGCSQEETTVTDGTTLPEGMYPLTFTAVQTGDGLATRVEDDPGEMSSKWNNGDKIKVIVSKGGEEETTTCTLADDGTVNQYDPQLYWQTKEEYTINAWYSNITEQRTTDNAVSLADQSNGLAYVLKVEEPVETNYNNKSITLPFKHQLAKVRVKLEGDGVSKVNTVQVKGYTSCTVEKGVVKNSSNTQDYISMYRNGDYWEANLVPMSNIGAAGFIKLNGNVQANVTNVSELKAGNVYGVTITVEKKVTEIKLNNLTGPYEIKEDGEYILTGETTHRITINADATVVLKGVSINTSSDGAPIQISGYHTATLMLEGNNNTIQSNVEKYPAILPDQGSTVVIDGTGSLKAQGSFSAAGIGSGGIGQFAWETISAGYIKILGGSVEAIGGTGGTGIGCGYYGNCQGVEILGGTVTARAGGGYDNPAIGSSTAGSGTCTYVKLERCTINAHPEGADVIVANSVTPSINDSGALATAGVTLNVN